MGLKPLRQHAKDAARVKGFLPPNCPLAYFAWSPQPRPIQVLGHSLATSLDLKDKQKAGDLLALEMEEEVDYDAILEAQQTLLKHHQDRAVRRCGSGRDQLTRCLHSSLCAVSIRNC